MDFDIDRKIAYCYWNIIDNLAYKMDKIADLYENTISKEYEKEYEKFDIQKDSNILHIGCGAYPITAMTITKINGAKIVGIDKNPRSVKLAKKMIHKKKLQSKVTIEQGDGENYPIDRFDTILVSGCSYPREKILKHIFETAKNNSKIIVREPHKTAKSLIKYIDSYQNIEIVKKIENYSRLLAKTSKWHSFCLIKKS